MLVGILTQSGGVHRGTIPARAKDTRPPRASFRARGRLVALQERLHRAPPRGVPALDGAARAVARRERGDPPRPAQPRRDRRGPGRRRRAAGVGLGRARAARLRGVPRGEADARDRQGREKTTGRVVFTVGGFRADGARVERAASAIVTECRPRGLSRPRCGSSALLLESHRDESRAFTTPPPTPGSARRGTIRQSSQGQPPDHRHLAGLGRRRARLRPGRQRRPLRRRRRALGALPQRRTRALHGRHREGGAREVRDRGHPRDRPRGGRRRRRRVSRPLRDERLRPRAPVPQPRRRHVRGDDRRVRDRGAREHALGGLRRRRRRRGPRPLRGRDRRLLHADARPRLRRQRRPPELPLPQRRPRPLHRRHESLGPRGHDALDALDALPGLRPGRPRRPDGHQRLRAEEPVPQRNGKRFVDVAKKTGTQARAYGMSGTWADFDGDGRPDLYTTGTDTQWYFLHEYPAIPVGLAGRLFLPFAIQWCEDMASGNTLLLQRPTTRSRTRRRARARRRPAGTGAPSPPTSTTTVGPTSTRPTACGATAATATSSSSSGGRRSRTGTTTSRERRPSTARARASTASSATGSSTTAAARPRGLPSSRSVPSSRASTSRRTAARSSPSTPTATARSTSTYAPSALPKPSSSGPGTRTSTTCVSA